MRYILLSLCLSATFFAKGQNEAKNDSSGQLKIFAYVEQMPSPGYDLMAFLSKNVIYPVLAQQNKIEGRVIVRFVINEDGSISDGKIVKGIGYGCDEEALRVIKAMPKWRPGKQNGQRVKVYFTQPITFTLEDNITSPPPPGGNSDTGKKQMIYTYAEGMPSPGYDFNGYLQHNLHYPQEARKAHITGKVIVKFVVSETGAIEKVTVLKGIGAGCDEEAARVIREMPTWKPGTQNGKPVKVYFTQPINFNLD